MFKKMKNKKGFTLIELIVVIAILGILALIAVPRLGGFTESARIRADEATAATVAKAAEMLIARDNMTTIPASLLADLSSAKNNLLPAGLTFKSERYGPGSIPVFGGTIRDGITVTGGTGITAYPPDGGSGGSVALPVTTIYEAEIGTRGGGINTQTSAGALPASASPNLVGSMNSNDSWVQVNNVDGGTGGTATLVVRYALGQSSTRTVSLYVNGVDVEQLTFATTANYNTFTDKSISIQLVSGTGNTIRLEKDSGDTGNVDVDRFTVTK